jgi:hypothetical protein
MLKQNGFHTIAGSSLAAALWLGCAYAHASEPDADRCDSPPDDEGTSLEALAERAGDCRISAVAHNPIVASRAGKLCGVLSQSKPSTSQPIKFDLSVALETGVIVKHSHDGDLSRVVAALGFDGGEEIAEFYFHGSDLFLIRVTTTTFLWAVDNNGNQQLLPSVKESLGVVSGGSVAVCFGKSAMGTPSTSAERALESTQPLADRCNHPLATYINRGQKLRTAKDSSTVISAW